jgi:hypothetical protein
VIHANGVDFPVSGNPSSATFALPAGAYEITADAIGGYGDVYPASGSFQVQTAAYGASATDIYAVSGAAFTGTVASFWDPNPDALPGDYTAYIGWADGTVAEGTITADTEGGINVAVTHTFESDESFRVGIFGQYWNDTVTSNAVVTSSTALTAVAIPMNAVQGTEFDGPVARFTDGTSPAAQSGYTATIDWGDGTTAGTGTVTLEDDGTFTVSGTHTFADAGDTDVVVTVTRTALTSHTDSATRTVSIGTAISGQASELYSVAGQSVGGVFATFSAAEPDAVYGDFTATITWADSSTSTGTVVADSGGGFDVTLPTGHTFATSGDFSVEVDDANGTSAILTGTAHVGGSNGVSVFLQTIDVVKGIAFDDAFARFTDGASPTSASGYTATIDWGDGTATSSGAITQEADGSFTVRGAHTYPNDSVGGSAGEDFTASVTVTRTALTSHTATLSFTQNASPQLTGLSTHHRWDEPLPGSAITYQFDFGTWLAANFGQFNTRAQNRSHPDYNYADWAVHALATYAYMNGLPIDIYTSATTHYSSYQVASRDQLMADLVADGFGPADLWGPVGGKFNTLVSLDEHALVKQVRRRLVPGQIETDNATATGTNGPLADIIVAVNQIRSPFHWNLGLLKHPSRTVGNLLQEDTHSPRISSFNFPAWTLQKPGLTVDPLAAAAKLTWTGNAASYHIYRTKDGGTTTMIPVAANASPYTDSGLVGSALYHYTVAAVDANGVELATSDQQDVTTDPAASVATPTNLKVRISAINAAGDPTSQTLTWDWTGTGTPTFHIFRRAGSPTATPLELTTTSTSHTFVDSTVPVRTLGTGVTHDLDPIVYFYTVTAVVSTVASPHSDQAYAPQIYFGEGGGDTDSGVEVQQHAAGIGAEVHYWLHTNLPLITPNPSFPNKIVIPNYGNIVLGGFSFGGSDVVDLARQLGMANRNVEYMALLDPVSTRDHSGDTEIDFTLTPNVLYAEDWSHSAPETVPGETFTVGPGQIAGGRATPTHLNYHSVGNQHGDQVRLPWVYNAYNNMNVSVVPVQYPLNNTIPAGRAGIKANLDLLHWFA